DIGNRSAPFARADVAAAESAVRESGMAGDQARDRAVAAWNDRGRLFQLLNNLRVVDAADTTDAWSATAALVVHTEIGPDPRFRQQLVGDRKRPRELLVFGIFETGQAGTFWCLRRCPAALLAD